MWKSLLAKNKPAEGERDRAGNKARTRLFFSDLIDTLSLLQKLQDRPLGQENIS